MPPNPGTLETARYSCLPLRTLSGSGTAISEKARSEGASMTNESALLTAPGGPADRDLNPSYGKKGHFRAITATVPPDIYERLIQESARRKIAGEPNQMLSALLREALERYLQRLDATDGGDDSNPGN